MSLMHLVPNRFSEPVLVLTLAITLVSATAGCSSSPSSSASGAPGSSVAPAPQLVVHSGPRASTLTIRDETGLVMGFADGAPIQAVRDVTDVAVANVPERPAGLGVAWVALPCETNPTLIIFNERGRLRIILDRGPRIPRDCESLGVIYGITLEMAEAVPAHLVDIQGLSRDPR